MTDSHAVVQASYHRNGIGGAGFYVALIDSLLDNATEPRRFLLTWFPTHDYEGERTTGYQENVAVVAVDEVAKGNIAMHPLVAKDGTLISGTGGNAWRGADEWQSVLPEIEAWIETERGYSNARFGINISKV